MKRIVFLLLFVLFSSPSVFAQQGFEVGINVLPQTTWIMNKTDFDQGALLDHKPTFGIAYGLDFGYNFTDNLGIQVGFLHSQQGQNYEGTSSSVLTEFGQKLAYLKNSCFA